MAKSSQYSKITLLLWVLLSSIFIPFTTMDIPNTILRTLFFALSTILVVPQVWSQDVQFPITGKITGFEKKDFNADPQFWSACENPEGIMFFGNNDGVIIHDGEHWHKLNLPNNSSVRSLAVNSAGTVYAGGYNEIGVVKKDGKGRYVYRSMMEDLQLQSHNLENIWDIQVVGNKVLCRTFTELVIISGKTATHIPANTSYIYSGMAGSRYFIQDSNHGIMSLGASGQDLTMAFPADQYNNEEIFSIVPGSDNNKVVIITKTGNVYNGEAGSGKLTLSGNIFTGRQADQVTSALKYKGVLLIGTLSSKILLASTEGKLLETPALLLGLPETVVHKLYRNASNNIWVMQNNGLSYIDLQSPYSHLFSKASVYDALATNNCLYLATNQGIYVSLFNPSNPSSARNFTKTEGIHGQAWAVQSAEGDVIASHDTGLYQILGLEAKKIGNISGFWKITPIKDKKGYYLASHYNGLYLLRKEDGQWILGNKLTGFNESSRDIMPATEPGVYWICHGYKGVFRIRVDSDYSRITSVDHYTNRNGLQSAFNVNVARWQGDVVFTTNTGIYSYNAAQNRFVPHKELNRILDPEKNTRKLLQAGRKTWFVQDDEAGYFYTTEKKPALQKELFLNLKGMFNRGMEAITVLSPDKVLFGTTSGLYLYSLSTRKADKGVATLISGISYSQDQEIQNLPPASSKSEPQVLPNQTDILRFEFAAPKMNHGTGIQYSYMLENVDKNWSAWQTLPYKEYTHLRPGTYTFKVKSRNTAGVTAKEAVYYFTILPKWYQTNAAYIAYGLLSALLVVLALKLISKRVERQHRRAREEEQRTKRMLEMEVERLRLQRDKEQITQDKQHLEEDVLMKSKELANYTMLLLKKKEIFGEITSDLKELREYSKNEESRKKIFEIFQKLNQHKIGDDYMEVFDVNFEKVHHNFFEKLKKLNPTLTKRELRLCAFVKMDLTNKEISPLLNISLRGVENARYRVRKKLNVAHEDNFVAYLEKVAREAEPPVQAEA